MSLYPQINSRGAFKLSAPFQTSILENNSYLVIAVRRFGDIRRQGIDPYAAYYQPKGIPVDVFRNDESNNVAIVTLQGGNGEVIFVPTSYILEFPSLDGIPYVVTGLSVKIGSMHTQTDMAPLINAIKATILTYTGYNNSIVTPVALSAVQYIDSEAHEAIENNRITNIDISTTPNAELVRLRAANAQLLDKVAQLEQYIVANQL